MSEAQPQAVSLFNSLPQLSGQAGSEIEFELEIFWNAKQVT